MNKSKSISLVIIDTDVSPLARSAVERTISLFPVDEVLIFSSRDCQWGNFPVIPTQKITSLADYNRILLTDLPHKLNSDFALIIQFDGFVIDPSSFSDFFFKFDYIGAPWPAGTVPGHGAMVGNGGFSLRSKKLIETVANCQPAIMVDVSEDVTICRLLRPLLEERDGICFAPVEVARHFSIEFEDIKDSVPFGFHGLHILPKIYQDDYKFLIDNLPVRCFKSGSYQLRCLQKGFSHSNAEAQRLFAERAKAISLIT